jgi:hypothetical protein
MDDGKNFQVKLFTNRLRPQGETEPGESAAQLFPI